MKKVNAQRFQKPEDISFKPMPMPENPPAKAATAIKADKPKIIRPNDRSDGRTDETTERPANSNTYLLEIPPVRVKIRHSFDIFADQKASLDKIQFAIADTGKGKPALGDMIQEAIDLYIKEKAKKSGNIKLISKPPSERPNDRSDEQTGDSA
jgi:hypothetical protein